MKHVLYEEGTTFVKVAAVPEFTEEEILELRKIDND